MDENGATTVADFSLSLDPHPFTVNADLFHIIPQIPLGLVADVLVAIKGARQADGSPDIGGMLKIYDILLTDDCTDRFRERMSSKKEPIGHEQLMRITNWALEKYGLRPSEPSAPSAPGSDGGETSITSMDGPALTDVPDGSTGLPGEPSTLSTHISES
jgi:hypothetical protein